jgi:hypothetical protein
MASTENIKRVISNPDNQMRESKITKIVDNNDDDNNIPPEDETMLNTLSINDVTVPTVGGRVESTTDSSLSDENNHNIESPDNRTDTVMQRTISNESHSTTTGEARASIGNWGWFDDVHGHESVFLPGMTLDAEEGGANYDKGEKKQKGGLLQMYGSGELISSSPLYSEKQRGECVVGLYL